MIIEVNLRASVSRALDDLFNKGFPGAPYTSVTPLNMDAASVLFIPAIYYNLNRV